MILYFNNYTSFIMLLPSFIIHKPSFQIVYTNVQLVLISYVNHLVNYQIKDYKIIRQLDYLCISHIQLLSLTNSTKCTILLLMIQLFYEKIRYLYMFLNYIQLFNIHGKICSLFLFFQLVGYEHKKHWTIRKKLVWHIGCSMNVYYSMLNYK